MRLTLPTGEIPPTVTLIGGAELARTIPSTAQPPRIALPTRPHGGIGTLYEMAAAKELRMSKSDGDSGGSTMSLTLAAARPPASLEPTSLDFASVYDTSAWSPFEIRRWNCTCKAS